MRGGRQAGGPRSERVWKACSTLFVLESVRIGIKVLKVLLYPPASSLDLRIIAGSELPTSARMTLKDSVTAGEQALPAMSGGEISSRKLAFAGVSYCAL